MERVEMTFDTAFVVYCTRRKLLTASQVQRARGRQAELTKRSIHKNIAACAVFCGLLSLQKCIEICRDIERIYGISVPVRGAVNRRSNSPQGRTEGTRMSKRQKGKTERHPIAYGVICLLVISAAAILIFKPRSVPPVEKIPAVAHAPTQEKKTDAQLPAPKQAAIQAEQRLPQGMEKLTLPVAEEVRVGKKWRDFYIDTIGYGKSTDAEIQNYLIDLVHRIADAASRAWTIDTSKYHFTATLVNDLSPNAYATPGGFIYVTHGLLLLVGSEDELAAVLAHEVMHVLLRHTNEIAEALIELGDEIPDLSQDESRINTCSQGRERVADENTFVLLPHAGYPGDSLKNFLKRAREWEGTDPWTLNQTHPPAWQRLNQIKTAVQFEEIPAPKFTADKSDFQKVVEYQRQHKADIAIASKLPATKNKRIRTEVIALLDAMVEVTGDEGSIYRKYRTLLNSR